jgi:hypothetical protein
MHDAKPSTAGTALRALAARSVAAIVLGSVLLAWTKSAPAWEMERAHYALFGWAALGIWWLGALKRWLVAAFRLTSEPRTRTEDEEQP